MGLLLAEGGLVHSPREADLILYSLTQSLFAIFLRALEALSDISGKEIGSLVDRVVITAAVIKSKSRANVKKTMEAASLLVKSSENGRKTLF